MDDPLHVTAAHQAHVDADAAAAAAASESEHLAVPSASSSSSDDNAHVTHVEETLHAHMPPITDIDRDEQRTEWLAHFLHSPSSFHARSVHRSVDDRGLRGSLLRSVYWKLFLGELHRTDMAAWGRTMQKRREEYEKLVEKNNLKLVKLRGPVAPSLPGQRSRSSSSAAPAGAAPLTKEEDEIDLRIHNPLSSDAANPWTQHRLDNELSETIRHDLSRTHADQDFFISSSVQDIMFNVLFLWSKEVGNEREGRYRQGMNEILSPLVLVVLRESQWKESWGQKQATRPRSSSTAHPPSAAAPATPSSSTDSPPSSDDLLSSVLDRSFVEADVYFLFCRCMAQMGQFFIKADVDPRNAKAEAAARAKKKAEILSGEYHKAQDAANASGGGGGGGGANDASSLIDQTPIVKKCHYIHHILLSTLDPQLYAHLVSMDVSPNLYILRWYRLMLCREFHLEDTLVIWDVVFATMERNTNPGSNGEEEMETTGEDAAAEGAKGSSPPSPLHSNQFVLVEYVCIAMLLYVRSALLHGDNVFCLRRLLRYPPVEDIRVLLARALHFLNSWQRITSDPTLTREAFDPTHITEQEQKGIIAGAFDFQGPWHSLTEGMGADAPLEDGSGGGGGNALYAGSSIKKAEGGNARANHHGSSNHHQSSSHHHHSHQQQQHGHPSATSSAKSMLADGLSSLKSLVKGVVAKAGELPQSSNASSASAAGGRSNPSASPPAAHGAKKSNSATLPSNSASRKLPQASGISHFLSPSSFLTGGSPSPSPPTPSSSSSSSSSHSSHASSTAGGRGGGAPAPLSQREHDELVLLRRSLSASEKSLLDSQVVIRSLLGQLEDARSVQKQMGGLMAEVLKSMESEWERSSAEGGEKEEEKEEPAAASAGESTSSDAAAAAEGEPKEETKSEAIKTPFSEDVLLSSLAELKHIKDVLVGRLGLSDIIEHLQASAPPAASTAAAATSTAASSTSSAAAPSPLPSPSRAQLLSDMAAIHARQSAAASASAAADGPSFPYNLPPAPSKKFAPLFEAEAPRRDKVSELFELDESDAVPGLYPSIHRVTAAEKEKEKEKEKENVVAAAATVPAAAAAAAAASPSPAAPSVVDPLLSPPRLISASPSAPTPAPSPQPAPLPAAAATAAPAVAALPAPALPAASAATRELLSGLLSSSSTSSSSSGGGSLFDSSPPSSPFGPRGASLVDAQKKKSNVGTFNPAFDLEEDDNSILLPSAQQFKQAPVSYKPPPPKNAGTAAAAPSASAAATAAAAPRPFKDPLFSNDPMNDWMK